MKTTYCTQLLENELNRYKAQRDALLESKDYTANPEQRELLLKFYAEKIAEFEWNLSKKSAKDLDVSYSVVPASASKDIGEGKRQAKLQQDSCSA
jgi:hypothetical protein